MAPAREPVQQHRLHATPLIHTRPPSASTIRSTPGATGTEHGGDNGNGGSQTRGDATIVVDIAYQTPEIGPGLVLRHPMCVVIGRGCRVGHDVTIFHGVTLGNRLSGGPSRPDGSPVVEDGVLVGAGAKILGPVTIGARSTVGANSVVTSSIPAGSVAAGCRGGS